MELYTITLDAQGDFVSLTMSQPMFYSVIVLIVLGAIVLVAKVLSY